MLEFFISFTYT